MRQAFKIEEGAEAAPEGILIKPETAALVRQGRGIIKRKAGKRPLAEEWAEHKKQERELEERHRQRLTQLIL